MNKSQIFLQQNDRHSSFFGKHDEHPMADEDLDRAIALSLQQEEQKQYPPRWDALSLTDLDAALARSMQEEGEHKQQMRKQPLQLQRQGPIHCNGCNSQIVGMYVEAVDGNLYHKQCYGELFSKTCTRCATKITGKYLKHHYWDDESYCLDHQQDATIRKCCSCSRWEPKNRIREGFHSLPDRNRAICTHCVETACFDSAEAQDIFKKVLWFFENILLLTVTKEMRQIPVLAVDASTLNEQRNNGIIRDHHDPQSTVRGLTISNGKSIRHFSPGSLQLRDGTIYQHAPTLLHVEEVRDVTAILVLFGLPAALTGSILAHELLHAYLKLSKENFPFNGIAPEIEEGLCNVASHKFLEFLMNELHEQEEIQRYQRPSTSFQRMRSVGSSNKSNNNNNSRHNIDNRVNSSNAPPSPPVANPCAADKQLLTYFKVSLETNRDYIYGEGFRKASACVNELGLQEVLNFIKTHSDTFPAV